MALSAPRLTNLIALAVAAGTLLLPPATAAQQDAARPQPQDIGAQPGHLPKVHFIPSAASLTRYPIWVEASKVFRPDGSVDSALIPVEGQRMLAALMTKAPDNGCVRVGPFFEDIVNPPERNSIEQATRNSRLVLRGRVSENAYGVSGYIPGQLLRVVPEETIKGKPRDVEAYYVFIPMGRFKLGNVAVCKTDSRYPDPPRVGDEVLLFVPDEPSWQADQSEPYLELLDDGGIATIHANATLSLPKRLRTSNPTTSVMTPDDFLARVRTAAGHGGR